MRIDGIDISKGTAGLRPEGRKPDTPEEAARQFEEVLIKQMLHTMTKDLFDSNITGDDAPQWMGAYGEMQGDILSTELARQLGESGKLGISELLLKQWERQDGLIFPTEDAGEATGSSGHTSGDNDAQANGQVHGRLGDQINGQISNQTDRQTDGQTNGQMNGQANGRTDGPSSDHTEGIDPINPYTEV